MTVLQHADQPRGIRLVLRQVHQGEVELESELHVVAERHRTDHEIRHVAVDLARWSLRNRQRLADLADAYGDKLSQDQDPQDSTTLTERIREKTSELLGRRPEPGLLLLGDLRHLYLLASGNSALWTMLGQAAQATKDGELLEVVSDCHDRTSRQVTWCNATIKALSPQVLTTL